MNWGSLGAAILGNLTHVVTLVETIRGKRRGKNKQDLAVDLFFAVVKGQDGNISEHIEFAEDEIRGLINAFVALENKLNEFPTSDDQPDGVSNFRIVDPTDSPQS